MIVQQEKRLNDLQYQQETLEQTVQRMAAEIKELKAAQTVGITAVVKHLVGTKELLKYMDLNHHAFSNRVQDWDMWTVPLKADYEQGITKFYKISDVDAFMKAHKTRFDEARNRARTN